MNIELTPLPIAELSADIELIIVINKDLDHRFVKDKKLLKKIGFDAAQDETALIAEKRRIYVGADTLSGTDIRSAAANAVRALKGKKYKSLKVATYLNQGCTYTLRALVEGLLLGAYSYEKYKSKPAKLKLKHITISLKEYNNHPVDIDKAAVQVHKAQIIADATNFTRDIVNMPPDDCYPAVMADIADGLAEETGLTCKILKPKEIKKEKMCALLAVGRASVHTPRVIHLSYQPKDAKAVISLVGKGVTYDSGGLSLKPADYMVTMKADKSGGSAVMGIIKAVAELNLPIEVHGFIGAVENMIGGNAYKPDDVLVAKNGKTIEVRNTDAEGRLVLADVLCYAQQEVNADYIIDYATLTGACVVGLGQYTSGVLGNSEAMKKRVVQEALNAGELATALDFNRHLKKTLKSEIADICNISNTRYGGAITAAQFLSEFIDEDHANKWAHVDIAGPAFVEHPWAENPYGASGAGVRMTVKLLEKIAGNSAHQ